jgi:hypothetical protein
LKRESGISPVILDFRLARSPQKIYLHFSSLYENLNFRSKVDFDFFLIVFTVGVCCQFSNVSFGRQNIGKKFGKQDKTEGQRKNRKKYITVVNVLLKKL